MLRRQCLLSPLLKYCCSMLASMMLAMVTGIEMVKISVKDQNKVCRLLELLEKGLCHKCKRLSMVFNFFFILFKANAQFVQNVTFDLWWISRKATMVIENITKAATFFFFFQPFSPGNTETQDFWDSYNPTSFKHQYLEDNKCKVFQPVYN